VYLISKSRIYYFIIDKREMVKGVGVESMQKKVVLENVLILDVG